MTSPPNSGASWASCAPQDGRRVFGLGGACTGQKDGKIYFVGAVEERDPATRGQQDRQPLAIQHGPA